MGGLLPDARNQVSSPDGVKTAEGRIYIIYDRERRKAKAILLADFTEEDILAGEPTGKRMRLHVLVNQAG